MPKNYPGNIEKRGNAFRIRFMQEGRKFAFTIRTKDRREAERIALRKFQEIPKIAAERDAGGDTKMKMSSLLSQFETEVLPTRTQGTRRSYHDSLKPIRSYFLTVRRDPLVRSVRTSDIAAYLAWRRSHRYQGNTVRKGEQPKASHDLPPVGNRTLAKDRAVLHSLFSFADRLEYRTGNPVSRANAPKWDTRDPAILTDDQFDALLQACAHSKMLTLYVLTLAEAGLRCESEALWLTWDDVQLDDEFLWIASGRDGRRTKSGRGRFVPMTERLREALRAHFAEFRDGGSPWIFHHVLARGKRLAGDRLASLRSSFKSAAKRAELPSDLHQHDLRHRRVTTWLSEGKNPVHVKEAMGHADLRTTMGYTHLSREHLKQLVR